MTPIVAFYLMTGLFFVAMVAWGASSRQYKRALDEAEKSRDWWHEMADGNLNRASRYASDLAIRDKSLATMKAALKQVEAERAEFKAAVKGYEARPRVKAQELIRLTKNAVHCQNELASFILDAANKPEPESAPIYG